MNYTWDDIFDRAEPVVGDDGRWQKVELDLKVGDTIPLPGTTKGPATVETAGVYRYDIHPSGILLRRV
ncbi:hypothetical protein [Kribbella sindirgiensis]|uniref:Uncharacterized protein n=1 Tax=Kribbella sindirgiensis TaxID=1124744 RepID=A0A4R0I383_9ACTN|nr:hypothetical protein [Kribbella sindirgiensis]TCC19951.1 hypothetical protein E0H50_37615 [Kribbella sindirgiensis]